MPGALGMDGGIFGGGFWCSEDRIHWVLMLKRLGDKVMYDERVQTDSVLNMAGLFGFL